MDLRTGKISENVMDRSVRKRLGDVASPPCDDIVISSDPVTMHTKDAGYLAVVAAANDLLAMGTLPQQLQTVILLPEGAQEQTLRDLEDQITEAARLYGAKVTGGHTEVTDAVVRPVVTAVAQGVAGRRDERDRKSAHPGMDIVCTGWIGLEGTYLLASEKAEELLKVFPPAIVEAGLEMRSLLPVIRAAAICRGYGAAVMQHISGGGIYAALWEFSRRAGCGLEISLPDIPIRQETVEITNHFDINPYEMASAGSLLIAAENGRNLVEQLLAQGIHASLIGTLTAGKEKTLVNAGERQYLNLPPPEALLQIK